MTLLCASLSEVRTLASTALGHFCVLSTLELFFWRRDAVFCNRTNCYILSIRGPPKSKERRNGSNVQHYGRSMRERFSIPCALARSQGLVILFHFIQLIFRGIQPLKRYRDGLKSDYQDSKMPKVHRIDAEIVPLRLDQVNACVGNVLPLLSSPFLQPGRKMPISPSPIHIPSVAFSWDMSILTAVSL